MLFFFGGELRSLIVRFFYFLSDREKIRAYIQGFGPAAPWIFMLVQVLQVLLAPVPGEATGFIGGYLFGVTKGFLFSSIALSIGSIINFGIGRFLGQRYVRKVIPVKYLMRFDTVAKREGALIVFMLFIFPGFPKDYLCLLIGLSALPFKIFFLMVTIGRMPGTFILSLQGAMLFEQNYLILALATAICSGLVLLCYRHRESFYAWIEKQK
jgi:uncharacterized membrane protein YdjX (TVP38/TMEM64 family)